MSSANETMNGKVRNKGDKLLHYILNERKRVVTFETLNEMS